MVLCVSSFKCLRNDTGRSQELDVDGTTAIIFNASKKEKGCVTIWIRFIKGS